MAFLTDVDHMSSGVLGSRNWENHRVNSLLCLVSYFVFWRSNWSL